MQPAKAQYEEKDFVRYSVKEGLSDNYITCLQQDSHGYLWVGTDNGLNRFDGNSFKVFYQGTESLPLLSGKIGKLKQFAPDHLGILSSGGFQLLGLKDYSLQNFIIPDSSAFTTYRNRVWDAIQLGNRSIAVTTAAGFYAFNRSGKLIKRYEAYGQEDIGKKRIFYGRDIFSVNQNEYLVYVEENGLASYNAEKNLFTETDQAKESWQEFIPAGGEADERWNVKYQINDHQFLFIPYKENKIIFYDHSQKTSVVSLLPFSSLIELNWHSSIARLNDSVFAINCGTAGFYMLYLDKRTGQIQFNEKKILPSQKINCLFFDRDNSLWVGTYKGLLHQKINQPLINSFQLRADPGLSSADMFTCTYRYRGKLYAGQYSKKKGLVLFDAVSMQAKKQITFYNYNSDFNEVLSMEMYHKDTLWIGTNGGLLWFDTKTEHYGKVLDDKKELPVAILAPARKDGYTWMCALLEGIVVRYHIPSRSFTVFTSQSKPALPFEKVKSIVYDSYGDVWIGGHSLARWNNKKQLFDTLINVYGGVNKYYDDILTLSADVNGSLWLHNAYNYVLEYRISEKQFVAYTTKDGLPADEIESFSPVIDNILWIGSSNHLTRFDTRTKKITLYDEDDGLPEPKPTGRRIYFDKESGNMYMCNNEYLVRFPFKQDHSIDRSSNLIVQEAVVNNKTSYIQPSNELRLKYSENNVSIHFTVIDFEKSNYQFSYTINNAENWINLAQQRVINLNNMAPGKYLIQIKASGRSGSEKMKELTLLIDPPYWKTVWFIILCSLSLTAGIYFIYRKRINQVRQKADIDRLLAQTEMKALHAQMNPHFIFNSLNSIREMILNNENKEASHFLSKFAHLIRITLDQSGQTFISLRNTVDYLERYIEMEQIRNNHFTCSIITDEALDTDETLLPPMLIQPFIENAIWHGTSGNRRDIVIKVEFKKERDNMVCTIDDNGIGVNQSLKNKSGKQVNHKPVGIVNIENRIKLLNEKYELHSTIRITDKKDLPGVEGSGTIVILQLPLEIKET